MEYVNLLPDPFMRRMVQRQKGVRWLLVGLGVVVLISCYSFVIRRNVSAARQELAALEQQFTEKQELTGKLGELELGLERAANKRAAVDKLVDEPAWARILADIAEAAHGNAWLEQLKFAEVKVRDDEAEGQESLVLTFNAEGHAPSNFELANFMALLERSPHFDDVELNYSELRKTNSGEDEMRFEIEGRLL